MHKYFALTAWMILAIFGLGLPPQQQVQPVAGVLTLNLVPGTSSFKVILSANVTSVVIQNPTPGTIISVIFTENATGGFAVAFGGNIANPCTVATSANTTTICQFQYDATSNTWNGIGGGGGGLPSGVIDTTAAKYATPIGHTIPDATFTSGQATIDCTFSNDCNFTSANNGNVCYGTNFTTDVSILNPTSVVLPEGTLTITDAQHATCSGGNSTATTVHNGTFVWGALGHTQLNSAFTDCIAQNGCVLMLPPGLVIVESAVGNSYCGGIAASTPCIEAFGYGRIQIRGWGQSISQLAPTPNFSAASCTGGPAADLTGCFFSAPSIQMSDWGIFGAGNSACGAGFNGKTGIIIQGNGNYNSYLNSLLLLSWCATTAGFTGLKVESESDTTLHDVHLDGMGNIGCQILPGFPGNAAGATLTTLEGTYCAVTGSTSLLTTGNPNVSSHGGVYGWTNGAAGAIQANGGHFVSQGDTLPYVTSNASFAPEFWCTGSPGTCVIDGDYINNPSGAGAAISVGGTSTVFVMNSSLTGASAGIVLVSGTKAYSLGGNQITGTTKSINTTSFPGGTYFANPFDIIVSGPNDSVPTCAMTTGGGTGPACALVAGSTNSYGTMRMTPGTTPGNAGTTTFTFNGTFAGATATTPSCTFTLANTGTGTWNARGTVILSTRSTTVPVFAWDNNAVALTAASTYDVDYTCTPR